MTGYYYHDNMNSGLNHAAAYSYDGVNRLTAAGATGNWVFNQTYTYTNDGSNGQYGNMSCSPAGPACGAVTYNAANNHQTTSGYTYDLAGNLTGDGTNTYQWDAESRLAVAYNGQLVAFSTNTYNALGQRVRDVAPLYGTTTDEAYDPGGNLLWGYAGASNSWSFVPFNGHTLAEEYSYSAGSGTLFDHPDGLGSLTASTAYNGSACQERLFYPFGELATGAGSCGLQQVFAQLPDYDPGDEYNTANRHYSPGGRWLSPDPLGGDVSNPQSLNRYAYALNNPTSLVDPTGLNADDACLTGGMNPAECQVGEYGQGGGGGGFDPDDVRSSGVCFMGGVPGACGMPGGGFSGDLGFDLSGLFGGPGGGVWSEDPGIDIMHIPSPAGGAPCDFGSCSATPAPIGNGFRAPDYYSLTINVAILPLWPTFGPAFVLNVTKHGHIYIGLGPQVGKALLTSPVSSSLTANWLTQQGAVSDSDLDRALTGGSVGCAAGNWVGAQGGVPTGGSKGASSVGVGYVSPQAGCGWTYSGKFH